MTLCLALLFSAFFPGLDQPLDMDELRLHHGCECEVTAGPPMATDPYLHFRGHQHIMFLLLCLQDTTLRWESGG